MASLRETIKMFDTACQILISSDKSLHDRLDEALAEISSLDENDFNRDFRRDFRQLTEEIRANSDTGDGSDRQSDIALSILDLCIRLHRETQE
jgi:phosphate uptake regulator